ncbi:MAG: hypothetical protein ACM3UX_01070 [Candidatus Woesearchaeota archaeon]
MRRLAIVGTAVAFLVGAAAAYATFYNSYNGSKLHFAPKVAGSKAHPAPVGLTEVLKAGSTSSGDRAAPLKDVKITVYGVVSNGGKLPVCTDKMIESAGAAGGFDKACPKGSLIAQGPVSSLLGPYNDPTTSHSVPCNPFLHVYNGGKKTVVNFFTTNATHQCHGLVTGQTAPYDGHISYRRGNWVLDTPLPADISTQVAGQPGLYGSLIAETLNYSRSTTVKGKVLHYMDSVACGKHNKRSYLIQFTSQQYSGGDVTQKTKGTDKC